MFYAVCCERQQQQQQQSSLPAEVSMLVWPLNACRPSLCSSARPISGVRGCSAEASGSRHPRQRWVKHVSILLHSLSAGGTVAINQLIGLFVRIKLDANYFDHQLIGVQTVCLGLVSLVGQKKRNEEKFHQTVMKLLAAHKNISSSVLSWGSFTWTSPSRVEEVFI